MIGFTDINPNPKNKYKHFIPFYIIGKFPVLQKNSLPP